MRIAFFGAALMLTSAVQVSAVDIGKISGHTIVIEGSMPEEDLKIDGRSVHKDAIISFDELVVVDGVPALLGSSSPGGNACDGSPFVLSFPKEGRPRLDGPIDNCAWFQHQTLDGGVEFSTHEVPGQKTDHWRWTPKDGFAQLASTDVQPDADASWDSLREKTLEHPSEAFQNAGVSTTIKGLLGSQFGMFQQLMTGVGSGEFKGDDYVGTACRPHMCMDEAGLLFLSAHDRQAFAAWKPDGGKIVVFPPVKQWPEKAKSELRLWAKKWD